MPRVEPRVIQKELEQGKLRPLYWLYGGERMIARELFKRIRKTALGLGDEGGPAGLLGMAEDHFDGTDADASRIVDAAQSLSFGGGTRLIVVRDAHALKGPEALEALMQTSEAAARADVPAVCVCFSKDLDGRKKFSKVLLEKAAVISCEEVPEGEREAWIQYLAKRRGLALPPQFVPQLAVLDPWSLDIVDQELEKFDIASSGDVFLPGGVLQSTDAALDAFFSRDLKRALLCAEQIAERPDEALPLLGLLGWNVRQLALMIQDQKNGTRNAKFGPQFGDRFRAWARGWSLGDLMELQEALAALDFGFKQTPKLPLGLWTSVATRFCR